MILLQNKVNKTQKDYCVVINVGKELTSAMLFVAAELKKPLTEHNPLFEHFV